MKRFKMCYIVVILLIIFSLDKVNAACDNKTQLEINTASSNVSMDYTIESDVIDLEGNVHPELSAENITISETSEYSLRDKITVNVNNVTDKVYVVFYSEEDGINREYHYSDLKNGSFSYELPDNTKIRNYTLTIYSDVSECSNEKLRTINKTTPMYNELATQNFCENNNAYYCQEYVTTPINVNEEDLINKYLEQESEKQEESNNETEKESNTIIIIGIVIVLVLIVAIVWVIIRNKKNKDKIMKSIGGM